MKDVIPAFEEEATDTESYSEESSSFDLSDEESYKDSDTDSDSDPEKAIAIGDAKIFFNALNGTFTDGDASSAFTAGVLGGLNKSINDFIFYGEELPMSVLTNIGYKMCLFIIEKPKFDDPLVVENSLIFFNLILSKAIDGKLVFPGALTKDDFVDKICCASVNLKSNNRKYFQNASIRRLMSDLDINIYKSQISNQGGFSFGFGSHSFFQNKPEINPEVKNDKLIYADYYFEDWDKTLFDSNTGKLYSGVKELIGIAASLGVQHAIITARNGLIDLSSEYSLYNAITKESTTMMMAVGWSIPQQLKEAGFFQHYDHQNIIYCDFRVAYKKDDVVVVVQGQKAKSDKVSSFEDYCALHGIDKKKAIIFDDRQDVWTGAAGRVDNLLVVDNDKKQHSTFTKMTHVIAQRICYNEHIDPVVRASAATALLRLLEARGERHLSGVMTTLASFASEKASPTVN